MWEIVDNLLIINLDIVKITIVENRTLLIIGLMVVISLVSLIREIK